jgi:hypothetical protein
MGYYLLRTGNGFFLYAFLVVGVFLLLSTLIEMMVIKVMDYTPKLKKPLLDSFLANLVSVVCCFILIKAFGYYPDEGTIIILLVFYIITVGIESLVLFRLNPGKPLGNTIRVSVVMNLCTFLLIYFCTGIT